MNVTATLFGQMITFVIFVWFIKAYLWEPLTKAMDDRSNKIADGLAAAEKGQQKIEQAEIQIKYSGYIQKEQENVEKFAQDRRVPFSDFASLCRTEPVIELIKGIIDEVNKNFARVEQIKDFRLIDTLLTAEDDELTATMKLKRSFVEQKYQSLIDEMYQ